MGFARGGAGRRLYTRPRPSARRANMPPTPLVSVVVPTYQRLAQLRESVESVVRQTYPTWELIVVDDGSTDGTTEWVQSLADPRIRLLALPHSGNLGYVRNRGNAEAR